MRCSGLVSGLVVCRSTVVSGNILSRAMHKMVAYVDHWFTNLCVWMLVTSVQLYYYSTTVAGLLTTAVAETFAI